MFNCLCFQCIFIFVIKLRWAHSIVSTFPVTAGRSETTIACFSSKQKRSIDEKDTLFPRGHGAGSDARWDLTSRNGIDGKRGFEPACRFFIRGWALPLLHLYLSQGQGWQALKVAVLALKTAYIAGVLHPAILLLLLRRGAPPSQQCPQKIKIPRWIDF